MLHINMYVCIYVYIYVHAYSRFCIIMCFTLYSVQDAFMTNGNSIFQLTLGFTPIE